MHLCFIAILFLTIIYVVCQIQANVGGVVVPVLDTIVVSAVWQQRVTVEYYILVLTIVFV